MERNVQSSNFIQKLVSDATNFVAMATDTPASEIVILNNTGQDIDVRQDNGGVAGPVTYTCKDGTFVIIDGICNANQVMLKLNGGSTPATVKGRIYA